MEARLSAESPQEFGAAGYLIIDRRVLFARHEFLLTIPLLYSPRHQAHILPSERLPTRRDEI